MHAANDAEPTPTDVNPKSVARTKETSPTIRSVLAHPFVAATGFIGSIASIMGLLLFFLPSDQEAPLTIGAIVSAVSFVEESKREQYFVDHFKGQRLRFDGQYRGAMSAAMTPGGGHSTQFGMTYIFATQEGVQVYAVFDESMRELLPILATNNDSVTAVEGVLHEVTFFDNMVIHVRSASLPEYGLVPQ